MNGRLTDGLFPPPDCFRFALLNSERGGGGSKAKGGRGEETPLSLEVSHTQIDCACYDG